MLQWIGAVDWRTGLARRRRVVVTGSVEEMAQASSASPSRSRYQFSSEHVPLVAARARRSEHIYPAITVLLDEAIQDANDALTASGVRVGGRAISAIILALAAIDGMLGVWTCGIQD